MPALSQVMESLLLDVRENVVYPTSGLGLAEAAIRVSHVSSTPAIRWKETVYVLVLQAAQGKLLEVIRALDSPRGFPSRLHRRKQQRDQDADDRDDDQEFDEGKAGGLSIAEFRILVESVHGTPF
jgi:hypothetical protein